MTKIYAVGDLQGCSAQLDDLMSILPEGAKLICLGDLVNRGPDSLGTLRRLKSWQEAGKVECILGNHDLNLLARDAGLRGPKALDTLDDILNAPDRAELIDWLRYRPMALSNGKALFVHAGVLPQWDLQQTLECANEVEKALRKKNNRDFLANMYGNTPNQWKSSLKGVDRLRVMTNAFTRLRFCTPQGEMEFDSSEGVATPPLGCVPWFNVPTRKTRNIQIFFGHWSTLGLLVRKNTVCLDTGCVWGGKLTAAEIHSRGPKLDLLTVDGYDHPMKM